MNIRARLTLLFVLLVGSIMLLFSLSVYYVYDQHRQQDAFQRLKAKTLTAVQFREDIGTIPKDNYSLFTSDHILIYGETGQLLYINKPTSQDSIAFFYSLFRQAKDGKKIELRHGDYEAIALRYMSAGKKDYYVVASAYDSYGFQKLGQLRRILIIAWLISLVVVAVAGWLFANDAMRPVSEIVAQVKDISATNIHKRLRLGRQRDELSYIAYTFNKMLNRLEEAFTYQKNFVANASHELRTPLAVITGHLEVALLQSRSATEYRHIMESVFEEAKKMNMLVNGLLELAQMSTDQVTLHYQPIRIDELLWKARSNVLESYQELQIDIYFDHFPEHEEHLTLLGDPALLQTAFTHLMTVGYSDATNQHILVQLTFTDNHLQLTFSNKNFFIKEEDLTNIFEPFHRTQHDSVIKSYGISLALPYRIVVLHKGHTQIKSTQESGTSVVVTLPLTDQPSTNPPQQNLSTSTSLG